MADITTQDQFISSFKQLEAKLPGAGEAWVKELRAKALESFKETGIPTTHDEWWKYTDLSTNFLKVSFGVEAEATTKTAVAARLKTMGFSGKSHLLVFVNGSFSKEISSIQAIPSGVKLRSLAASLSEATVRKTLGQATPFQSRGLNALSLAYFTDGLFLEVSAGKAVPEPIHVVYLSVNGSKTTQSHLRNLIVLGDDAQAQVIEHYWGDNLSPYWTNTVTEVHLSRTSRLEHNKLQQESLNGYHTGNFAVKQNEGSRLVSRVYATGGALGRSEVEVALAEKKAECVLEGLYLTKGKQHLDTRTFVDHIAPACATQESFKGVLDGESTAIFDGRILVRENSQKTDAKQSNKNLLLSKEAKVYSKPQLQIYADDVKCSHGSATGQMDEEALFYLQSRGIGREAARKMMVYAFAGEMVEKVEDPYLKPALTKMMNEWMDGKP